MNIRVHSIHFNADVKLLDFIQEKIDRLVHYDERIIGGDVYLKLDKASNEENKIVQIKLHVPGNNIFTKYQCRTFEEATDLCVGTLSQLIKKRKDKMRN
jgi:putative sigma-54 modulation protein